MGNAPCMFTKEGVGHAWFSGFIHAHVCTVYIRCSLVPSPPPSFFVACSTEKVGKAWDSLSYVCDIRVETSG